MMRQVLIISALASLSTAQLCFDATEVAGACTAGTEVGSRVMSALYQCDPGYYGYGAAGRAEEGDQDWQTVLDRRALERQTDNCHSVQDIQADFHMYASYELCVWENIGWYNLSNVGMIDFYQYQEGIDSLAPQVSDQLQWSGLMGECWSNSTTDIVQYFQGCDYTDEDWSTLYNIIYAWSDLTCFGYIFNDACSSYLRGEIYYYFSQAYTNSYDTYNSYDYTTYTK